MLGYLPIAIGNTRPYPAFISINMARNTGSATDSTESETTTIIRVNEEGKPGQISMITSSSLGYTEEQAQGSSAKYKLLSDRMNEMKTMSATSCTIDVPSGPNNNAMHVDVVAQGPGAANAVASIAGLMLIPADGKMKTTPAGTARCSGDVKSMLPPAPR